MNEENQNRAANPNPSPQFNSVPAFSPWDTCQAEYISWDCCCLRQKVNIPFTKERQTAHSQRSFGKTTTLPFLEKNSASTLSSIRSLFKTQTQKESSSSQPHSLMRLLFSISLVAHLSLGLPNTPASLCKGLRTFTHHLEHFPE